MLDHFLILNPFSAAMEIGPQPHGVVRSNVYTAMRVGVQNMLDWVRFFNSGEVLKTLTFFKTLLVLF